jgi:hypothetical protein
MRWDAQMFKAKQDPSFVLQLELPESNLQGYGTPPRPDNRFKNLERKSLRNFISRASRCN